MTDKPTDTEIDAFVQVCREKGMRELAIFQAVLDKWGQPAHSGEQVAWKHDCAALLTNDVELWIDTCPHCGKPRNAPQPVEREPLTEKQIEAAAKKLSECMDYPWESMPKSGRAEMRKHAQSVIAAAHGIKGGQHGAE